MTAGWSQCSLAILSDDIDWTDVRVLQKAALELRQHMHTPQFHIELPMRLALLPDMDEHAPEALGRVMCQAF